MRCVPLNRLMTRLVFTAILSTAAGAGPAPAASRPAPARAAQSAYPDLDKILQENALFFNILVSFSYTAAVAQPEWGLGVSDINVNLITRDVRDARGHQLVRVRVAGVVRKNHNVELSILNPEGKLVGKAFLGYDSGEILVFNSAEKPILAGTLYSNGRYFLDDLRLAQDNQGLASGYVDPCFDCGALGYAWYDALNAQVGGGHMLPSFNYDGDGNLNDISLFWDFEGGTLQDGVTATGTAEYDLSSEATGAINNVLFDSDRTAESFFANPYDVLMKPQGDVFVPRFTDDTIITVTNPSDRQISVTYVARNFDGSPVSGDGIENPVTYTFAAGQQYSAKPEELFLASNAGGNRLVLPAGAVGWMEVYSYDGDLHVSFLEAGGNATAHDGNNGSPSGGSPIVFPNLRLSPDERTEIELINPSHDDIMGRLQLLDSGGNIVAEEPEYFMYGSGMRSFVLGDGSQFLRSADPGPVASLRVSCNNANSIRSTSCSNIVGLATVTDQFGSVAGTYATSQTSAGSLLFGPYFVAGASGGGEWQTTVHVTKFDGFSGSVFLYLYDSRGNQLTLVAGTLSSAGQVEFPLNGATLPWGDRLTSGYLRLVSDSGGIAGDVSITWSNGTGSLFAIYPLSPGLHDALQFNQIAQVKTATLDLWTGVSIMNDQDLPLTVTVQVFRADGSEDRSVVISLGAKEQYAALLSDLLQDPGYSALSGYLSLTSADGFAAVVLYGDSAGNFLAAVPGIPR